MYSTTVVSLLGLGQNVLDALDLLVVAAGADGAVGPGADADVGLAASASALVRKLTAMRGVPMA
jgi:hypothetical protein